MATIKPIHLDMLAPDAVKQTDEFGIAFGTHIETEWFSGNYNDCRFVRRKDKMRELRGYMTNDVDINKYKNLLGVGTGDKSALALDWGMLPSIPKFVKVVVDGFSDDLYSVQARAVDKYSQSSRDKYRQEMRRMMAGKDYSKLLTQVTGVDVMPPENLPETEEELDLYMEMTYQQKKEVAMEIGTEKIMAINDWHQVRNMILEDIAVVRIGAAKTTIDSEVGIKLSYVDPESLIYSRGVDSLRNSKDKYYFAEVKYYTIDQVKRLSNNKFSDDELRAMASQYAGRFGNPAFKTDTDPVDFVIEVIEFCFKTTKNHVVKKKYNKFGGYKYIPKAEDWNPPDGREATKIQNVYDVWYSGSYIVGCQKIYDYGIMSDAARPSSNIKKAIPPYSIYEISTSSLVEKMMPLAQQLHITNLKLQQLIAKMRPKGIAINIDALENIDLGAAGILEPADQIEIFNQDGNLIYSGRALEGDMNSPLPIHDLPSDVGRNLSELIVAYNHYVQQIRDVTGINPAKDGSSPVKGALVGTQQLNLMMANNATSHIFNGYLDISKHVAENIILRLQSLAKYGKLGEGVRSLIGHKNADALEQDKEKYYWVFSIDLRMKPTQEEEAKLNENIQIAIQNKEIELDDVIDIRSTENIKLANHMLKVKKKQKERRELEREKNIAEYNSQLKIREQKNISQTRLQEQQEKIAYDRAMKEFEAQLKAMDDAEKRRHDIVMENLKFRHQQILKGTVDSTKRDLEMSKENRKDERTKIQATQQSELIDQRNQDSPPKDFTQEQMDDLIDID